jgi:hypothetical protein
MTFIQRQSDDLVWSVEVSAKGITMNLAVISVERFIDAAPMGAHQTAVVK